MKILRYISILIFISATGCITQFVPELEESRSLIVVDALLTDKMEANGVTLTRSLPMNKKDKAKPVTGAMVWITDDTGGSYNLPGDNKGFYRIDFAGIRGRKYTLHIVADGHTFESFPTEMLPVPPIDTLYYEKVAIESAVGGSRVDGCNIYLDTHDPANECQYYRWDYAETWEFFLPFGRALNSTCWISAASHEINVKSTAGMTRSVVDDYPIAFISNQTDRLSRKYSMLVNQYSLSRSEYLYWEKLKAVTQTVGSLYDITPAAIPNNIHCIDDPSLNVLGYFSVSSKKSRRVFVKDYFRGLPDLYSDCVHDTIYGNNPIVLNLNISVWILDQNIGPGVPDPFTTITYNKGCSDCTVRGTKVRPYFWE